MLARKDWPAASNRRTLDADKVEALVLILGRDGGFQNPPTIAQHPDKRRELAAGDHRLAALIRSDLKTAPFRLVEVETADDVETLAITENVVRSDLTPIELAIDVGKYHRIVERRHPVLPQDGAKGGPPEGDGQPPVSPQGGAKGGRPEGGGRLVARELGMSASVVQRLLDIDRLTDRAKAFALESQKPISQKLLVQAARLASEAAQIRLLSGEKPAGGEASEATRAAPSDGKVSDATDRPTHPSEQVQEPEIEHDVDASPEPVGNLSSSKPRSFGENARELADQYLAMPEDIRARFRVFARLSEIEESN